MKKKISITMLFILFGVINIFYQGCEMIETPSNKDELVSSQKSGCPAETKPFPSYDKKYGPPDWWCKENKKNPEKYPIFQISQNYTDSYEKYINESSCPDYECPWQKTEFKKSRENQEKYLKEIIEYAYDGNLEIDWVVQKNKKRKWFHTPFMHLDIVSPITVEEKEEKASPIPEIKFKVAREFIRGMTMERPSCLRELIYEVGSAPCDVKPTNPKENFQSWAISFYNERGASYIKKVWDEVVNSKGKPNPQNFPEQGFPEGTVAIKLLFSQIPTEGENAVDYLKGSIEWQADTADFIRDGVFSDGKEGDFTKTKRVREASYSKEYCEKDWSKCFSTLRLLQVDVAVRVKEGVSPIGWVFGSFIYHKDAKPFIDYKFSSKEEKEKKEAWLKIKWLGLQFGDDKGVFKGEEIKQTFLNKKLGIRQHFGCGDDKDIFKRRLNGPIDAAASSCISCHALSETPENLDVGDVPFHKMSCKEKEDIEFWFREINPRNLVVNQHGQFDRTFTVSTPAKPYYSLDYSLQLREGLRRYCIDSYNDEKKGNKCQLNFNRNDKFPIVTKSGFEVYTLK